MSLPDGHRRVAIHQPNYVPWCGYFAKMLASDSFVFLDDVQMPQGRSYVSRSRILRAQNDAQWLTVPVKRERGQLIADVEFADLSWPDKHLRILHHEYARAPYYDQVMALVADAYGAESTRLGVVNQRLIIAIARFIGWSGDFVLSSDHPTDAAGDDRLIHLTQAVGGTTYISGSGGDKYQDREKFGRAGLQIDVKDYSPVPYRQLGGSFVPGLSILDALFHLGEDAPEVLGYPEAEA